MNPFFQYFTLLCSLLIFATQTLQSLDRNYTKNNFLCPNHIELPSYAIHLQNYLSFIPSGSKCFRVTCSACPIVEEEILYYEDVFGEDPKSEEEKFLTTLTCFCKSDICANSRNPEKLSWEIKWLKTWQRCTQQGIFVGYFDKEYSKYFQFFEAHLGYCSRNPNCFCFWPESSKIAENINNRAYHLFKKLFTESALKELVDDINAQKIFFPLAKYSSPFSLHGVILASICPCFHFSEYYHVCSELLNFSQSRYPEEDYLFIKNQIDDILEKLYPLFITNYDLCLQNHYSSEVQQEKEFIKLLLGNSDFEEKNISEAQAPFHQLNSLTSKNYSLNKKIKLPKRKYRSQGKLELKKTKKHFSQILVKKGLTDNPKNDFLQSNLYFLQGVCFSEALQYKSAIDALSKAIKLNQKNRDAYIERALCYFELGDFESALLDYKHANKLSTVAPLFSKQLLVSKEINSHLIHLPKDKPAYAKGIGSGALEGMTVSAKEFIPSTLSSLRGVAQGLWAFALDPKGVSLELANACLACINFIQMQSTAETLQLIVPELKELIENWHQITDYERGRLTGFIIGKYGVDIFACGAVMKGIKYYRDLRRANTLYTLEMCSVSTTSRQRILEESGRRWEQRMLVTKDRSLCIEWDKQNKHIPGSHNFDPIKGTIELPKNTFEELVLENLGTGQKVVGAPGFPGYKERVDFGEIIGKYGKILEDGTVEKIETTKGIIVYSKNGVHVYPSNPDAILK